MTNTGPTSGAHTALVEGSCAPSPTSASCTADSTRDATCTVVAIARPERTRPS